MADKWRVVSKICFTIFEMALTVGAAAIVINWLFPDSLEESAYHLQDMNVERLVNFVKTADTAIFQVTTLSAVASGLTYLRARMK